MTAPVVSTRDLLAQVPRGRVAVMVSGGKDSLATLDLCVRHFGAENVVGVLMYLVPDLECEWREARKVARRFGVQIVGVPHWNLSKYLKHSMFRPYTPGATSIRELKQPDVEAYIRKTHNVDWIAWGQKCSDGIMRNAILKRIGGIDMKFRRFYPIWRWRDRDVYGYLKSRKISLPKKLGKDGIRMGGVNLDADKLGSIRDAFPLDYAKILDVFPFAGASLIRHEMQLADAEKNQGRAPGAAR